MPSVRVSTRATEKGTVTGMDQNKRSYIAPRVSIFTLDISTSESNTPEIEDNFEIDPPSNG